MDNDYTHGYNACLALARHGNAMRQACPRARNRSLTGAPQLGDARQGKAKARQGTADGPEGAEFMPEGAQYSEARFGQR